MPLLPTFAARQFSPTSTLRSHVHQQVRHATLIKRPRRPYTFTQLVTLSDGSSYLHRTTSPAPVYSSTKDTRNTPLWNPSSQKLMNIEADEAGRLRAFRTRFGRGWDAKSAAEVAEEEGDEMKEEGGDNLMDLISSFDVEAQSKTMRGQWEGKKDKK
ncbi:MAG: hypothetical protein MMC23_001056 [Stictis urceolatum]|nr:hypothetical protein [Stictis urceolata]